MFKPKKSIPYLAAGLALGGCDGSENQPSSKELEAAVEGFCLHFDVCYAEDGYPEGACVAYYGAYLDSIQLVLGDAAGECLAAWEAVLNCYATSECGETRACKEEGENVDTACGADDGEAHGGAGGEPGT